jgi:uncharacterized protein YfbU (UPF0304 family)
VELSNGEKLILIMLSEIYEKLKIEGEIDPEFVRKAIYDESTWALAWKYPGIVGSSRESTPPVVKDVLDVLEMWEMLEHSYNRLQAADREKVKAEAKPSGYDVRFNGFDGNHETEYMAAAMVLIDDLDRFSLFKGRDLNSHMPFLGTYRRMLVVYRSIRHAHDFDVLNAEQIIAILNA